MLLFLGYTRNFQPWCSMKARPLCCPSTIIQCHLEKGKTHATSDKGRVYGDCLYNHYSLFFSVVIWLHTFPQAELLIFVKSEVFIKSWMSFFLPWGFYHYYRRCRSSCVVRHGEERSLEIMLWRKNSLGGGLIIFWNFSVNRYMIFSNFRWDSRGASKFKLESGEVLCNTSAKNTALASYSVSNGNLFLNCVNCITPAELAISLHWFWFSGCENWSWKWQSFVQDWKGSLDYAV